MRFDTQDETDPSCYTDPLDSTTYDPNDDTEDDMSTTSASVRIEFKPLVNPVRYDSSASLSYVINGPAPMSCTVTGGGTNSTVTHTPSQTTGQIATAPVKNTQQYRIQCSATIDGQTLRFEESTSVEVIPQAQEV